MSSSKQIGLFGFGDYPAAEILFQGLAGDVTHLEATPEVPAEDGLREPRNQGACIAARIQIQEEMPLGLQSEGAMREPADVAAEEGFEAFPHLPPGERVEAFLRIEAFEPLGRAVVPGQKLADLEEGLLRVGTSQDQLEKVLCSLIGDPFLSSHLFPEEANLLIDDVAEP
jgi:hypothetical protein